MPDLARALIGSINGQNATSVRFPSALYPPPATGTEYTLAIQTLAVEIIGVLFTGAGLILLVLQARQRYSSKKSREDTTGELGGGSTEMVEISAGSITEMVDPDS